MDWYAGELELPFVQVKMRSRVHLEDGEIRPYADQMEIAVETMTSWDTAETTCVCGDFIGGPICYDGVNAAVP